MKVLVTGCYGFLGYSFCKRLLGAGHTVYGIDRLVNSKSDKAARVADLSGNLNFNYVECDISDHVSVVKVFRKAYPDTVVHFAAQYSLPHDTDLIQRYVDSNLRGFLNVIENAKLHKAKRFVYASSYLADEKEQPWSMYSISKRFGEDIARMYSYNFGMETVGLRYASVFGPFCRNDCAPAMLYRAIKEKKPIHLKGRQLLKTPFLDVDDAVDLTYSLMLAEMPRDYNLFLLEADDFRYNLYDVAMAMMGAMGEKTTIVTEPFEQYVHPHDEDAMRSVEMMANMIPRYKVKDTIRRFVEWNR